MKREKEPVVYCPLCPPVTDFEVCKQCKYYYNKKYNYQEGKKWEDI